MFQIRITQVAANFTEYVNLVAYRLDRSRWSAEPLAELRPSRPGHALSEAPVS